MRRKYKLSDAVAQFGWKLEVHQNLSQLKNGLGEFSPGMTARACSNRVLAVKGDSWDYAYSASHEMAEATWGWVHSADMFCEQANIMAIWLRQLSSPRPFLPNGEWFGGSGAMVRREDLK